MSELNSEQKDDLKEMEQALAIIDRQGVGVLGPAADARLQIAAILMLATRVQRLCYQMDNLIAARSRGDQK